MDRSSSWEKAHSWYDGVVGKKGHYYHEHVIFPGALRMLGTVRKLLDVGCGQGVLAGQLPKSTLYFGIDLSPSLIAKAKRAHPLASRRFAVHDATTPFSLGEKEFSHATLILSLQNMRDSKVVLENIRDHLEKEGTLLLVLNHPCFRIPRLSSWSVDRDKKLQSRKIDRYMSPVEIPILTHPSAGEKSSVLPTFHFPLSQYTKELFAAGFAVSWMEEWCSDKQSEGALMRMENRARKEFPLFLAILAKKRY